MRTKKHELCVVDFEVGSMKKSVKVYMVQDLILLTVLGVLLEGLTQRFASTILSGTPTIAFALFIVFFAVTRWKLWGLTIIPFLALSTWLGGSLGEIKYLADAYDWRVFIAEMCGLATVGINVVFYRNHRTQNIIATPWKLILIIIFDYAMYCAVHFVVYRLISSGNLFKMSDIGGYYNVTRGQLVDGESVITTQNEYVYYAYYIEQGFIYNLFGLIVCFVGSFIFRSQGIINNAVDKLVDDKKMADAEAEYLRNLGNGKSSVDSVDAKNDESDIEESKEEAINDSEKK